MPPKYHRNPYRYHMISYRHHGIHRTSKAIACRSSPPIAPTRPRRTAERSGSPSRRIDLRKRACGTEHLDKCCFKKAVSRRSPPKSLAVRSMKLALGALVKSSCFRQAALAGRLESERAERVGRASSRGVVSRPLRRSRRQPRGRTWALGARTCKVSRLYYYISI